jgi:hypothetical protein
MFFTNVIGEQAQKSVNSTRALADRSRSTLWRGVAAGLQQRTASRHGKEQDSLQAALDVEDFVDGLPPGVKMSFVVE